jgi:hypothetical protein
MDIVLDIIIIEIIIKSDTITYKDYLLSNPNWYS